MMGLGLLPLVVMTVTCSFGAEQDLRERVEKDYVAPALREITQAAQSLSDPGSTQAPDLRLPAGPRRDSPAGRMVEYVRRWWLDPAAQMAESSISDAARRLADPRSLDLPDAQTQNDLSSHPIAGKTIRFVRSHFVDPIIDHAHATATRAARELGSSRQGAAPVSAPTLNYGWSEVLGTWVPREAARDIPAFDSGPDARRPQAVEEKRQDSTNLIRDSQRPGPPGPVRGRRGRLKPVRGSGTTR